MGASDAELASPERDLGFALDEGVRAILSLANGCSVSHMYGEGFMSTTHILKQWKFFEDPRALLPFADQSGVIAYVVREKGKRLLGRPLAFDDTYD